VDVVSEDWPNRGHLHADGAPPAAFRYRRRRRRR
jgi:hypothetical protein